MRDKEFILDFLRQSAKSKAEDLQRRAPDMTGTEVNAARDYLPHFTAAVQVMNMADRAPGFRCRSSAGRVVKLLQPYDSNTYPGEPETLPAQWGLVWSKDPRHALPFIQSATSPYGVGECCEENGKIYRSKIPANVHAPSAYPAGWELIG